MNKNTEIKEFSVSEIRKLQKRFKLIQENIGWTSSFIPLVF